MNGIVFESPNENWGFFYYIWFRNKRHKITSILQNQQDWGEKMASIRKLPAIMTRYHFIVIFILINLGLHSQNDLTGDPIMQKLYELGKTNKIDSMKTKVSFFTKNDLQKDTVMSFFIYKDTIKLKDGSYSIGSLTIDPFHEFNFLQIGEWKTYYPSGKLFSTGKYQIGSYNICRGQAPTKQSYSYPIDQWTFWYENSQVMAEGCFDLEKTSINENTGKQILLTPLIGDKFFFYDKKGQKIKRDKLLIDKINIGFSQIDISSNMISKRSLGKVIIGQTLIQDIVKTTQSKLTLTSITYLNGLANVGGSCLRMERTKKFYRYKDIGITYIVSSGDTISGIIFYPPFSGQTEKGEVIGQTKIISLNIPKNSNKIIYSHPDAMGLHRDKKFSENAKHYVSIDGIYYGFKNRRKTISEIRIGH